MSQEPRVPASAAVTPEWLSLRARVFSAQPAVVAGDQRWSFHELDGRACRTARQLATLGVTADTRVALLLRNGAPFVVFTHALAKLGAVMVPLNVRLATPEVARQLADARATLLISDPALSPLATAAARMVPDLRCVVLEGPAGDPGTVERNQALATVAETEVGLQAHLPHLAVQGIIYTSATSGRPKGVLLTHGNHWWSAIAAALNLGHHRTDRWLACLPFYHVGGLAILWRSVIFGTPLVIHEVFDPGAVNRDIDRGDVTLVSVVSTMLQRLLDERGPRPFPSSLRCILLGGGPAPRALLETCVRRGVPVAPTYGLTETASQVATLPPEEGPRRLGSVGKALLPTELRIAGDDGRRASDGAIGEILVRGPTVMRGYDGNPDATARVLRDGWLHTGDLGYLDRDGYLYVVDRREDLIISGGENVYPAEVEMILCAHPAIEDAGVIGLPDPVWGQTVAAAVKVRSGLSTSEDAVRAFCAERLAAYKVPKRVWFVDALPRSPAGKLLRRSMRESAAGAWYDSAWMARPGEREAALPETEDRDARGFGPRGGGRGGDHRDRRDGGDLR
jgi:O-succinylbenzoic acid--CoA ligase